MTLRIEWTKSFQRDLKAVKKKHWPEDELLFVVRKLAAQQALSGRYRDHALTGDMAGYRECHIRTKPDWLLLYKVDEENNVLILVNTGSHDDLFKTGKKR